MGWSCWVLTSPQWFVLATITIFWKHFEKLEFFLFFSFGRKGQIFYFFPQNQFSDLVSLVIIPKRFSIKLATHWQKKKECPNCRKLVENPQKAKKMCENATKAFSKFDSFFFFSRNKGICDKILQKFPILKKNPPLLFFQILQVGALARILSIN